MIAIRDVKAQLDERLAAAADDETLIAAAERLRTARVRRGGRDLPGAEPARTRTP